MYEIPNGLYEVLPHSPFGTFIPHVNSSLSLAYLIKNNYLCTKLHANHAH